MDPLNPKPYIDMLVRLVRTATPLVKRVGLKKKQRRAFEELLAASDDSHRHAELARPVDAVAALAPGDPMSHVPATRTKEPRSSTKPAVKKITVKKATAKNAEATKAPSARYPATSALEAATTSSGTKTGAKKAPGRTRRAN